MNDERDLKLRCLELSGGDVERARAMFEWLCVDQGLREVQAYTGGYADGYQLATAALTPAPEVTEEAALEIAVAAHMAEHPQTQESAAEVEIPPGFTKWDGQWTNADRGKPVMLLFEDGDTHTTTFGGGHGGKPLSVEIIAYRKIEASTTEDAGRIDSASEVATSPGEVEEKPGPTIDVEALIASGEHSYDEVAEIAYPTGPRPEDASVFADDPPEDYAPVTNPEADAIAGAHDYYSPQAQARREREESVFNRFNPFRVKADA